MRATTTTTTTSDDDDDDAHRESTAWATPRAVVAVIVRTLDRQGGGDDDERCAVASNVAIGTQRYRRDRRLPGDDDVGRAKHRSRGARAVGLRHQRTRRELHRHRGDVPGPYESDPSWMPGTTEKFIGSWLAKNSSAVREDVVLATKIAGFGASAKIVGNRRREETTATGRLDRASIKSACDASLARLQTDYIDLYQLHWPDRYVPIGAFFGSPAYTAALERSDSIPIRESVEALGELIKAGKIKHYGLSNESTFGVCEFVRAADELGVPRPVSIQNSFCLLHRSFETELAEACAPSNFDIGLLPWTPLGGGALTGKYLDGASNAAEGRLVKYAKYGFHQRYLNDPSRVATAEYKKIADEAGVTLATLALAWCKSRFYVSSTIIGATSMTQLKENIDAFAPDVVLSEETLVAIDRVHQRCRDPSIMSDFS